MSFPETLNKTMNERGITTYRMAKDLNVGITMITRWRKGERKPDFDSICMICDYLQISADELLGR